MGDDGTYRTVQPGSVLRGNTQRDAQLFMAGDNDSTLQRSMVDGQFQWTTKQSSPSIAPAMYRITSNNKSRDSFTCNGDHILVLSFDTAPSAIEQESTDSFVFHQLRFENGLAHRQTNRFSTRASAELAHSSAIDSHQPFVWECSINDFLQCDEYVRSCACMFQPNEPIAFHPTGQLSLQQRLSAAMGVEATQQQAQEMAWSAERKSLRGWNLLQYVFWIDSLFFFLTSLIQVPRFMALSWLWHGVNLPIGCRSVIILLSVSWWSSHDATFTRILSPHRWWKDCT